MNPTDKPTHALTQIQRWMQTAVMHPDGVVSGMDSDEARRHIDAGAANVEQVLTRSKALSAVDRLAIYGSAYFARLLECMRDEFPATTHCLGEETFDGFAAAYLQDYPSRSYTLCQLGTNFPRYLVESRPAREEGEPEVSWPEFLADLVRFEWTFSEVFDGPGLEGKEALGPAQVQAVPAERWPEARLVPSPCLRVLAFRFPVQEYHAAVRAGEKPGLPEPAETLLALTRRHYVVRHSILSGPEYQLLSALAAGQSVGAAIEQVAQTAGADLDPLAADLHQWFQRWAAAGYFERVELP